MAMASDLSAPEPIAVIGLACRLPGASTVEELWDLLRSGRSAVGAAPAGRGLPADRMGGFLAEVDRFDPEFFGIPPREAVSMDPQQRLALELAWEALEHAGIVPSTLRHSRTGVFLGAMTDDYAELCRQRGAAEAGATTLTGLNRSILANRISYVLGLRGPSMTVDSGQSSSLVSVLLACESLWSGAATTALAGGVQLNITDGGFVIADRFGALSPDGRAYTFDARAAGYVRGEGGGMVVLKPLERALADGDRVLGVIRGGAVNNDGGGPSLTSPSADAQVELLRSAYANSGVDAAEVGFVELHGTGTPTGDPVEAASLGAVLGTVRPATAPLPVGSVKTVLGHLEGAAGIAGLLKVVLCLHNRMLTPSLNYRTPNPKIDLTATRLTVNTELRPLTSTGRPLVAGVSSFGMGGTNCHLVLAEWQAPSTADSDPESASESESGPFPVLLSGRTEQAVRDQASRLLTHVDAHPSLPPAAVAHSLASTRTHFAHRAGFIAGDLTGLRAGLDDLVAGGGRADVVDDGKCALLFTGQGSQRLGMGVELRRAVPAFADAFDAVAARLDPLLPRPLREVLDGTDADVLNRTEYAQPALFAYEVALAATLDRWGVRPDVLVGHSIGELAAARTAGVLSLEDAATLVAARGRLMQALPSIGAMVAVEVAEAELGQLPDGVAIAAVNGPTDTVLSGDRDAVLALARRWESAGRRVQRLRVSHAFHSAHLDPMLGEFQAVAETLTYQRPRLPIVSDLTGEVIAAEEICQPDYWVRHVRGTVRFLDAVRTARAHGVTRFLEVGPDAVLTGAGRQCVSDDTSLFACAGRARRPEVATLLAALTAFHSRGVSIDWPTVFADLGVRARERTVLPAYPFQRSRFWLGDEPAVTRSTDTALPALTGSAVKDLVLAEVAGVLGLPSATGLDVGATFQGLGLDSVGAVELRNRLVRRTGRSVPAGLVFDHPTPAAVINHVRALTDGGPAPEIAPMVSDNSAGVDPVVIVGMACRLPGGVASPEDLWRLVSDGVDAISPFPADRGWDLAALSDADGPGGSRTQSGGFLADVAGFDAGFFGVSPREAVAMDPQQRLLLEVSWEALERAGFDVGGMRGSRTGVFTGLMYHDYAAAYDGVPTHLRGHRMTGGAGSVASGRVAYRFGFEGPAITIDTACSSSLVALHLAVRSVRGGECDVALAGGVTVLSSPFTFVEFSRQGGLSADGRCRSYGDGADGTGWAEGVGVVVVERLSRARESGHRVLAVVRGTAVNQDGASNGLTAPNGLAQQRVIRAALADAGLSTSDVDVVEGHGTGTALGDPIEVQALSETYGRDRVTAPLLLGSVKSNIGHTQAAAGVAGLVKMVLALDAGVVPGSLHADPASSHVDWAAGGVEVVSSGSVAWPESGRPRRAGVSSFGISGTNAHVVLEQADDVTELPSPPWDGEGPVPLVLSAHDPEALRARAEQFQSLLAAVGPADLAHSLAQLEAFTERAVVVGADEGTLQAGLVAVAEGRSAPGVVRGQFQSGGRLAVLFTGQGSQRAGMGRELASRYPVFAETLDEICGELDRSLAPHGYRSVREVMFAPEESTDAHLLDRTGYTQAALFAFEVSMYRLVESWGVRPDVVAGHSIGEVTAAHVAGVLSLADACALVAARGRLMQALPSGGAMVAVEADERHAAELLPAGSVDVAIAAVNAPNAVVLSGTQAAVAAAADALGSAGRRTTWLNVSHAFHSPLMEPMLAEFRAVLETLTFGPPTIALVSNVTGRFAEDDLMLSPDYWIQHASVPVRFHDGVRALVADGVTATFEVGPAPVLTALVEQACADEPIGCVPAQHRNRSEVAGLMTGLAGLHVTGIEVDWTVVLPKGRRVPLPTYPFQRRRFWLDHRPGTAPASLGLRVAAHPLLGARIYLPGHTEVFTTALSVAAAPWLADHVVAGAVVVPGAALVELVLAAGAEVGAGELAELVLAAPLTLTEQDPMLVQIEVGAEDAAGRRAVTVHSRENGSTAWTRHASGALVPVGTPPPTGAAVPVEAAAELSVDELYSGLAATGLSYGPAFRRVTAVSAARETVLADVRIAEDAAGYLVHPVLLDAALHGAGVLSFFTAEAGPRLPFSWSGVRVHEPGATVAAVRITRLREDTIRVELADPAGKPVVTVDEMTVRTVPADRLAGTAERPLRIDWIPIDARTGATGSVAIVDEPFTGLTEALSHHGRAVTRLPDLAALDKADHLPDMVVLPWRTGTEDDMPARVHAAARRALAALQAWLSRDRGTARLVVLTEDRPELDTAAVRGLIRSAQREHPGRVLLVETDGKPVSLASLPAVLTLDEPQSSIRNGRIAVPRLGPAGQGTAPTWRPDGTVLITGASGALGDLIARHLATTHGVRRLLLASRRGSAAPNANVLRDALTESGAEVVFAACDVADRAAVADLLAGIPANRPLTGVVHAAGVLDDGVTEALTPERLAGVLRPKVDAAWHLHTLTADLGLDHFVLFSSASAVFGAAGQANYASANAFLDALAEQRVAVGLPATAMAWAPWREAGMAGSVGAGDLARLARLGMAAISNEQGLALFDAALSAPDAAVVPLRVDRAALADRPTELPALLRGLVHVSAVSPAAPDATAQATFVDRLSGLSVPEREQAVAALLRAEVATALGGGAVDTRRGFRDLGVDSLIALELRNRLIAETGLALSTTVVFDYPSPALLAAHISEALAGDAPVAASDDEPPGGPPDDVRGDEEIDLDSLDVAELVRLARAEHGPGMNSQETTT
ncbi:type I polyketide synthase [Streptomyces sp. NPDC057543]|uniref:type I polyketide synthase n=1 Tax=Streptomyces sp. NPDC057543 TaxID=3346163 RepID=UPI003676F333